MRIILALASAIIVSLTILAATALAQTPCDSVVSRQYDSNPGNDCDSASTDVVPAPSPPDSSDVDSEGVEIPDFIDLPEGAISDSGGSFDPSGSIVAGDASDGGDSGIPVSSGDVASATDPNEAGASGSATELPDTGGSVTMLLVAAAMISGGIGLRLVARRR